MSENSKIEWTDHTFNPWEGCQKVSPGCDHCYAETRNARFADGTAVNWGPGAPRRRTSAANWRKPLAWNMENFVECEACGHRGVGVPWRDVGPNMGIIDDGHQCAACGSRSVEPARARVFCASLADVFDNAVDPVWRRDLFALIHATPNLDWLLLTKRIGNAHLMIGEALIDIAGDTSLLPSWPWPNVWLGASIVNQVEADRDIPKLLATPAAMRFLSMEPLLGPVDLKRHLWKCCECPTPGHPGDGWMTPPDPPQCCGEPEPNEELDWVIVGGESGPDARPMHPDWARSLRDQCAAAGVPFLFKQWGEWASIFHAGLDPDVATGKPYIHVTPMCRENGTNLSAPNYQLDRVGKKAAGRQLDGAQHDGFPGAKSGTF